MMSSISDQVRAFLRDNFPGATVDDEYYFVSVRGPAQRRLKHEGIKPVAAKLSTDDCWLVAVNVDGIAELQPLDIESQSITYKPDWNIEEAYTEWFARVRGDIDLDRLSRSTTAPSALALISPAYRIVLDIAYARVHARSVDELAAFLVGLEDFLEPLLGAKD
jgi:hypothetical protein